MKKRFLALFLALVMAFALAIPAGAVESETTEVPTTEAPTTETPAEPTGSMAGSLVILHSNDVHGAIDGYATIAAMKASYEAAGAAVLLVDAGDYIQGDPSVSISEGATAIELMDMAGYDVVTLGNHEFDYGYANLKKLVDSAKFQVVAANVLYDGKTAFDANTVIEKDGKKIGVFGLVTPETATKAHPGKIQGVTFLAGADLVACAKEQVADLKAKGCDVIVCLGHLGIDAESTGNRSIDVLEKVDGIDVFIDGHSHSTLADYQKLAKDGVVNGATVTSTGTKFENIGVVTITADGTVTAENVPLDKAGVTPDATIAARAAAIKADIETEYGKVFAKTEVDLNGEKAPGNRTQETNLGDLITDAMLWQANSLGEKVDAAITNGGGIRASIAAGDITKKDVNTVLPFGNTLYMVKVTGAELEKVLEASTCAAPDALGGFPQVAGITFVLNTGTPFAKGDAYPDSTYFAPKSVDRVTILTVGGEAFDRDATYTIVTNDFLGAGGDTYYGFKTSTIGYDLGVPMDEVLMDYITSELKGVVTAEQYGDTQGRITQISYSDVKATAWYNTAVNYVTLTGQMNGVGGAFQPNTDLNRAMMVTILYRLAGSPEVTGESTFTDVPAGQWYTNAVLWAAKEGITTGTSETTFSPLTSISREQLAAFFYRFAQYTEQDVSVGEDTNILSYDDAQTISEYAIPAIQWACGSGLITGTTETTLSPKATATRAQVATILMRYTTDADL